MCLRKSEKAYRPHTAVVCSRASAKEKLGVGADFIARITEAQ